MQSWLDGEHQGVNWLAIAKVGNVAWHRVGIYGEYVIKQRRAAYKSIEMDTVLFIPENAWNFLIARHVHYLYQVAIISVRMIGIGGDSELPAISKPVPSRLDQQNIGTPGCE